MWKYAFCDLDFTLLDDTKNISSENIKTIKEFEEKGNHFIICTGRVPYAMKVYGDTLCSKDIVCANGGIIIIDNKEVKTTLLSKDIIFEVINYAIDNNLYARIFTKNRLVILNKPKEESIDIQLFDGYIEAFKENIFDVLKDEDVIKILYCDYNPDKLSKAYDYINKLNLDTELTYSASFALEINKTGQRKGNGIIDYCRLKGIDIKDTIAIGDNDNDISMFEVSNNSACPSNAIDKVKKIVDYVSPKSYKENAVADILKHYIDYEK